VPYQELRGKNDGVTSAEVRARVQKARGIQNRRGFYNSQIPARQVRHLCALDEAGERTLEMAVRRMGLSARAHDRILKVARTIADLDSKSASGTDSSGGEIDVAPEHVSEAIQYRTFDRTLWV